MVAPSRPILPCPARDMWLISRTSQRLERLGVHWQGVLASGPGGCWSILHKLNTDGAIGSLCRINNFIIINAKMFRLKLILNKYVHLNRLSMIFFNS